MWLQCIVLHQTPEGTQSSHWSNEVNSHFPDGAEKYKQLSYTRDLGHHTVGTSFHSVQSNKALLYSEHLYHERSEYTGIQGDKAYTQAGSWINVLILTSPGHNQISSAESQTLWITFWHTNLFTVSTCHNSKLGEQTSCNNKLACQVTMQHISPLPHNSETLVPSLSTRLLLPFSSPFFPLPLSLLSPSSHLIPHLLHSLPSFPSP